MASRSTVFASTILLTKALSKVCYGRALRGDQLRGLLHLSTESILAIIQQTHYQPILITRTILCKEVREQEQLLRFKCLQDLAVSTIRKRQVLILQKFLLKNVVFYTIIWFQANKLHRAPIRSSMLASSFPLIHERPKTQINETLFFLLTPFLVRPGIA